MGPNLFEQSPFWFDLGHKQVNGKKESQKKERERGADGQTRGEEGKFTQKAAEKEFGGQM